MAITVDTVGIIGHERRAMALHSRIIHCCMNERYDDKTPFNPINSIIDIAMNSCHEWYL